MFIFALCVLAFVAIAALLEVRMLRNTSEDAEMERHVRERCDGAPCTHALTSGAIERRCRAFGIPYAGRGMKLSRRDSEQLDQALHEAAERGRARREAVRASARRVMRRQDSTFRRLADRECDCSIMVCEHQR